MHLVGSFVQQPLNCHLHECVTTHATELKHCVKITIIFCSVAVMDDTCIFDEPHMTRKHLQ